MELLLRILIPTYFTIYFLVAFVIRNIIVARAIGKNPMVFPKDDSAYSLLGRYFKVFILFLFLYTLTIVFSSEVYHDLTVFQQPLMTYSGIVVLAIAFVWTLIAQYQMHNSWRIGIDTADKTELVTSGLFSVSRNPIFFGMLLALIGLLLMLPNTFSLMFLLLAYVLIQVQIRLEEEYLTRMHGQKYLDYKSKVRRLI